MRNTVHKYVKNCHKCQVNKQHKIKYGKLPTKLVITNPWEVLWVDLNGQYTLKVKDNTEIDYMCLTIIGPASSWFEIVELLVTTMRLFPRIQRGAGAKRLISNLSYLTLTNHLE